MATSNVKFDRFIFVDWSASKNSNTGEDSIWIGSCTRDNIGKDFKGVFGNTLACYEKGKNRQDHWDKCLNTCDNKKEFLNVASVANPPTRRAAFDFLKDILNRENKKTLIGFDFGFGYPHETYQAHMLGEDWKVLWKRLRNEILCEKCGDEKEERFALAEKWNKEWREKHGLRFWGKPVGSIYNHKYTNLPRTKPENIKEFRITEKRAVQSCIAKGSIKSQWQLFSGVTVGSQTLLGIPYAYELRKHLKENNIETKVWPFETKFGKCLKNFDVLMCEIHFAAIVCVGEKVGERKDEIRDKVQVEEMCRFFAKKAKQKNNCVERLLSVENTCVSDDDKKVAQETEGWILGAPLCLQNSEHCDVCRKKE